MMARGDVDILHLSLQGQVGDQVCIKILSRELIHQLCVFGHMNLFTKLHPLAATQQRV